MDEYEFIDGIDCCFPYDNEQKWRAIIKQGALISANAAFMVLYEICCAPNEFPSQKQLEMVREWEKNFDHPLKDMVVETAKFIISETPLPLPEAFERMKRIAEFKNMYNALGIVNAACGITNP